LRHSEDCSLRRYVDVRDIMKDIMYYIPALLSSIERKSDFLLKSIGYRKGKTIDSENIAIFTAIREILIKLRWNT